MLVACIGTDYRHSLKVRLRSSLNSGIDSQPGSVVHITRNSVAICALVDKCIFAEKFLQSGKIETPSEDRSATPVWQKGGYVTKQCRKLHVAAAHLVPHLKGPVRTRAIGLSTEFRCLESDIRS